MKKSIIFSAFALVTSVAFSQANTEQKTSTPEQQDVWQLQNQTPLLDDNINTSEQKNELWQLQDQAPPLYILDDKIIKLQDLKSLNPDAISRITVLKGKQATDLYDDNGKNGVIIITTKVKEIKDKASYTN